VKKTTLLFLLWALIVPFTLSAQDKATPRKGEGIIAFLERNNRDFGRDYQAFKELNKGKFDKNGNLMLGVEYKLPPTDGSKPAGKPASTKGEKKKEPLFGKKYEDYTVETNKLKGATYFIVAGHGGPDCGTTANVEGHVLHEDEYNYDVALRLARCLLQEGATVHIIIQDKNDGIRDDRFLKNSNTETCMGKAIPLNQKERLQQRSDKITELSKKSKDTYQRSIFVHIDYRDNEKTQLDPYVFYHKKCIDGKKLAENIRAMMEKKYEEVQKGRGYNGSIIEKDLHVLRNTEVPGAYVELGNMMNKLDQQRIIVPGNRQALAKWITLALIKDFEDSKKEEKKK
jgi:N-acetylmuramoyl-L-alanine amidase